MAGFSGLSFSSDSNNSARSKSRNNTLDKNISQMVLLEPETNLRFGVSIFKYLEGSKMKELVIDDKKPLNTSNITRSNKTLLKQGQIVYELLNKKTIKKLFFMLYLKNKKKENLGYIIVEIPKEASHTTPIRNIKKFEYMLVTYRIAPILLCDFFNKIFIENQFFNFIKTIKNKPDIEIIDGENKIDKTMDLKQCRSVMHFDDPNVLSFMTLKNYENFKFISYYLIDAENKHNEDIKLYTSDILLNLRGKKENTIDVVNFNIYNYDTNNIEQLVQVSYDEMAELPGNLNILVHMKDDIIHNMIIFIPSLSYKSRRSYISHGLDDLLLMFLKKIATPKSGGSKLRLLSNNRKISLFNVIVPDFFDLTLVLGNKKKKPSSIKRKKNSSKKSKSKSKSNTLPQNNTNEKPKTTPIENINISAEKKKPKKKKLKTKKKKKVKK